MTPALSKRVSPVSKEGEIQPRGLKSAPEGASQLPGDADVGAGRTCKERNWPGGRWSVYKGVALVPKTEIPLASVNRGLSLMGSVVLV